MYASWSSYNTVDQYVVQNAKSRLAYTSAKLAKFFAARQAEVDLISIHPDVRTMNFMVMRPYLMDALNNSTKYYEKLIVGDQKGQFYNTSGGNKHMGLLRTFNDKKPSAKPKSISKRDYWQATVKNSPDSKTHYISNPMISYTTGAKQVVVTTSIVNMKNQTVGLIGGAVPWGTINARISELQLELNKEFDELANLALISGNNSYWHHWQPEHIIRLDKNEDGTIAVDESGEKIALITMVQDLFLQPVNQQLKDLRESRINDFKIFQKSKNEYHFFYPVEGTNYVLEMMLPEEVVVSGTRNMVIILLLVLILTVFISISLGGWFSRKLTKPLYNFGPAIKALMNREKTNFDFKSNTEELNYLFYQFKNLITENRLIQDTINQNEERFSLAMQGANDGLWDWNLVDNSVYFSPRWKEMLGYSDEELENSFETWISLMVEDDSEKTNKVLTAYLEGKTDFYETEFRMKHKDGHHVLILGRGVASRNESGKPVRMVGTHVDITQLRKNEKALKELNATLEDRVKQRTDELEIAKTEAEKANSAKSLFLANMSHEIRTPLNGIIGLTDLLLKNKPAKDQLEFLEKIKFSSNNLKMIINDILDLSKIEAGKLDIEKIPYAINTCIQVVINNLENLAKEKGLELNYSYDSELPESVMGDPLRVSQVVTNLMGNAIKFTEQGSVSLNISRSSDLKKIEFLVKDTGIGISEKNQSKLFKNFTQADESTTRKHGGTGLGLAICKQLVKLMGGNISLTSGLGKGTEVRFALPLVASDEQAEQQSSNLKSDIDIQQLKGKKALLVEDNQINALISEELLTDAGFNVVWKDNGLKAVEAAKENMFDIIIMDIQMPVMDGYEATEKIRQIPEYKHIPIIAMTANAMPEDIKKSKEVGMDAHISKPIDAEQALLVIANCLS